MDQVDMEQKILRNLRESVMEEMDFSSEISDEKLFARIDYALMRESRKRLLSIEERTRLRRRVLILSGGWISFRSCWRMRA